MEKSINALTELQTLGVSLVHRGANKRKFAITKAEEKAMDESVIQSLSVVMKDAGYEGESEMLEALKKAKLDEKAMNAVNGAIRLLSAFGENEAVKMALAQLKAALSGNGYAEPEKAKAEDKKPGYPAPMKKALDAIPADQRAALEPFLKSALEASQAEAKERIEKAEKQVAELERVAKAERDARMTKEFIAKAKDEYLAVPGKPEDLGMMLKSIHEKAPEEATKLEGVLKSVNDVLMGSLLVEKGKSGHGEPETDVATKIEKRAEEYAASTAK